MQKLIRNICIIIIAALSSNSMSCMEQKIDNWQEFKKQGPLKELKFKQTERDEDGNFYGWLYAKEFDDSVYAKVILHPLGYYIDYVDPRFKKSLPFGFYYWKSTNDVKKNPELSTNYIVTKDEGSKEPEIIPQILLTLKPGESPPEEYFKAIKARNLAKRSERYLYLNSFQQSFGNKPTTIYLLDSMQSISINDKDFPDVPFEYRFFNEDNKNAILALIPKKTYSILKEWLREKLKDTGLPTEPTKALNTKDYIMNEQRVIDQFIIENILLFRKWFMVGYSTIAEADPSRILENIEMLEPCSKEDRKEFEDYLIGRFESWSNDRITGLTAKGIITCNPGLLQWD